VIRTRIPEKDDTRLFRMIMTRLVPFARKARPELAFNRKEVARRWRECKVLVSAREGKAPEGFISFKLAGGILTIDMLAVEKRSEGRGVGSALISAAERYGRRRGAHLVQLAVDEPNLHAQQFYTHKGYEEEIYLPDHRLYIMSKKLEK
jgi:ribosomal protein S18 acetylase RimI-like enzyme